MSCSEFFREAGQRFAHLNFELLIEPSRHMNLPEAVQDATPPFFPEQGVFCASACEAMSRAASAKAIIF
jgi:hypothetical protein